MTIYDSYGFSNVALIPLKRQTREKTSCLLAWHSSPSPWDWCWLIWNWLCAFFQKNLFENEWFMSPMIVFTIFREILLNLMSSNVIIVPIGLWQKLGPWWYKLGSRWYELGPQWYKLVQMIQTRTMMTQTRTMMIQNRAMMIPARCTNKLPCLILPQSEMRMEYELMCGWYW